MNAVQDRGPEGLSSRESYSFAVGEFGANVSWNMVLGFILFYYSNVVLLPVAAVGTLLLVTRIFDALADPLMGVLVDKTRTRYGRARPYLMLAGVPFAVFIVLTYNVPKWSQEAQFAYAAITFTVVGLLYSAMYVPYNAMVPLMTSNPADKLKIGSLRAIAAAIGSIVIYSSLMPLVTWLGGETPQRGFTAVSIIMATITALAMAFVFRNCRERAHVDTDVPAEPVGPALRNMLRNPVWLIVSGFAMTMFLRIGSLISITAYFANDVLKQPWAISLLLSSLSFSILIGGLIARAFLGRFGKRRGNIMAIAFALVLTGLLVVVKDNYWLFGALYFIANITLGIHSATIFTMIADAVDAQENLFGSRNEGLLSSSVSFGMKVGMAVGGAVIAYGLAMASYDPKAVTDSARHQIELLYFGAPALFAFVQLIIISFYRAEQAKAA